MTARGVRDAGWAHLTEVVPASLTAALRQAWDSEVRPHAGPLLRQLTSRAEGHVLDDSGRICNPVVQHALDPDRFPKASRAHARLFAETELLAHVTEALGASPALVQSVWVESTFGTALHRDVHPVQTGAPMIGAWVALEDIAADAGPLVVVPGSRTLDPGDADVAAWLAQARAANRDQFHTVVDPTGQQGLAASRALQALLTRRGLTPEPLLPTAGDVIVWASDLVHGSRPPDPGPQTRQSLLLHFVERRFAE